MTCIHTVPRKWENNDFPAKLTFGTFLLIWLDPVLLLYGLYMKKTHPSPTKKNNQKKNYKKTKRTIEASPLSFKTRVPKRNSAVILSTTTACKMYKLSDMVCKSHFWGPYCALLSGDAWTPRAYSTVPGTASRREMQDDEALSSARQLPWVEQRRRVALPCKLSLSNLTCVCPQTYNQNAAMV